MNQEEKRIQDYWTEAERAPDSFSNTVHQENIALALRADGVLPNVKESKYGLQLRFVRFLMALPLEGVVFVRRSDVLGSAYRYILRAIDEGYLLTEYELQTGRTVIFPSEQLHSLIRVSEPTDAEVINA